VALVSGVALISGNPAGCNVTSGRLPARIRGQVMYPRPVHGAASHVARAWAGPPHVRTGVLTRLPSNRDARGNPRSRPAIRIWPDGNGSVPGAGRPDLADLRAVTNAPGPARSRS
jgi:hypothetical protein